MFLIVTLHFEGECSEAQVLSLITGREPVGGGLELGGLGGDLGEGRVNESVVRYSNETNPPTACCRAGGEGDAKSIPQKMMLFKLWALGLSV